MTTNTSSRLVINPQEWSGLWSSIDAHPGVWVPTTEAMYWEMLGALPPAAMGGGAFLVGEAADHNDDGEAVYVCFRELPGLFEARHMTVRQFNAGEARV